MVYARALAVVILTSGPAVAFAGQIRNFPSARQEIPRVHVEAMVSDHDGFLWFATERGVVRYDGVDMKLILRNVDVNHAEASALALGPGGRVWVGWRGERAVEYIHGQHLEPIDARSTAPAHAIVQVAGDLWVGSDHGLTRIRGSFSQRLGGDIKK